MFRFGVHEDKERDMLWERHVQNKSICVPFSLPYHFEILGIIKTSNGQNTPEKLAGLPIVNDMTDLAKVHAVIVTDIENGQKVFDAFSKEIPPERVLTPPLLKVSRALPRMLND